MDRPVIIVDLDGTLCNTDHRQHHLEKTPKDWKNFFAGIPNDPVVKIVEYFIDQMGGHNEIVFLTGRMQKFRNVTKDWLENLALDEIELHMRTDDDFRPDTIVKQELYEKFILPRKVALVLEDRTSVVKMWRSLGLKCWQVADGDF